MHACMQVAQCVYNCLTLFLTDFKKYTFSDGHFTMMMLYDVTGGGPMEESVVELSVLVLKLIINYQKICNKT